MSADYFSNPLALMSHSGVVDKWYEVARSRERRLIKKLDVFIYLSMTYDDAFELLYVSFDELNRRLTKCYRGKFMVKHKPKCLIIRHGLCRRKFLIIDFDEKAQMVALSDKKKSKFWILSRRLPYDESTCDRMIKFLETQGFDVKNTEFFYE